MNDKPTLTRLLDTLRGHGFKITRSGDDRYLSPEMRAILPSPPPPVFFAVVEFADGDPMTRFKEVFEAVVGVFGRGPFVFTAEDTGTTGVTVSIVQAEETTDD